MENAVVIAPYRRTSLTRRLPLPEFADVAHADSPANDAPAFSFSSYGVNHGPNWPVIGALVAAHGLLLWALVVFDVVHIAPPPLKPLVVELIEIPEVAPPPAPMPETPPEPVKPVLSAPPPIVQPVQPALMQVAPSEPVKIAVTSSPAAPSPGIPMPVTAPDFTADYLKNPAPRYPLESRRLREQGTVSVKVLVTPEGSVDDMKIVQSSGFARLDKAALDAIRRWRFVPARQAGKPVSAWVIVPIPFVLTGRAG